MGDNFRLYDRDKDRVPVAMPLCELPAPAILTEFLQNNMPFGYYCGGIIGKYHNAMNINHTRAYWCVAESYEIPGEQPELMLRYFATRCTNKRGFEMVEVMRESPGEKYVYYRNMFYRHCCGWQNVYRCEEVKSRGGYYGYNYTLFEKDEFNVWRAEFSKYKPGISSYRFINPDFVTTLEKYRYSGFQQKNASNMVTYLRMYNENHGIEFFGKLGIMPAKSLVTKATKDGNFRKYLRDNAQQCAKVSATAVLYAYKKHVPIMDAWDEINDKRYAARRLHEHSSVVKLIPKSHDRRKIYEYAQDVGLRNYADYLAAVNYLGLDLDDTKVIFPRQFKRMHDLRINQMAADKAEKDKQAKRKLDEAFEAAAVGYAFAAFSRDGDAYAIVMPVRRQDLTNEGNALNHCVGRMGYDLKMVKNQSFIAFLRKVSELEKPFVTIEFSLNSEKIVQIYGDHNTRPAEDVIAWSKKWEKYVQKRLHEKAKEKTAQLAAAM